MYVGCRGEGDGMPMMGVCGMGRDGTGWIGVMWCWTSLCVGGGNDIHLLRFGKLGG